MFHNQNLINQNFSTNFKSCQNFYLIYILKCTPAVLIFNQNGIIININAVLLLKNFLERARELLSNFKVQTSTIAIF